ncbi:hypothetical protein [Aestuariispira insulae]|uniref:Uncharacterized protein n=1 Tax=Aestuariispira insulae TaxID=1461337 RepID=A0A3D9HVT2_9PROT|nr:hypothetical protein [Aestuariispira insulae]RED53623.1 hypothetical protein DFP90_101414 [Aestuariispira insulae]
MKQVAAAGQTRQPIPWVYLIIYSLFLAGFYKLPTVESMAQVHTTSLLLDLFKSGYHFIHLAPAGYLLIRAVTSLTDHSAAGKCLEAIRGLILLATALLFPLFLLSETFAGPATDVMLIQYFCALSLAAGLPPQVGKNHWMRGYITLSFPVIATGWSLGSRIVMMMQP